MAAVFTLGERKAAKVAALRDGVGVLRASLSAYAAAHTGRFLLFGSAARGELRHDSDVDILLDFPEAEQADAWRFAEDECWRLGLDPDVRPLGWCRPAFIARLGAETVELHGYDGFDVRQSGPAIHAAEELSNGLEEALREFRSAVDGHDPQSAHDIA
ncbi:MAG: nucleotidyltransferase domain-containing protein [Acetobacteraceae bacterium]